LKPWWWKERQLNTGQWAEIRIIVLTVVLGWSAKKRGNKAEHQAACQQKMYKRLALVTASQAHHEQSFITDVLNWSKLKDSKLIMDTLSLKVAR